MSCRYNVTECAWEGNVGVCATCRECDKFQFIGSREFNIPSREASNGSTASYYTLPSDATELQDLISDRNMNAQIGEIFRACYRMGRAAHSDTLRDARKILFYAKAEVERLEKLEDSK